MNQINEYKSKNNIFNNMNRIKDKKNNELKEEYEKYIRKTFDIFKNILNKIYSIHSLLNLKNNSKLNDLIKKFSLNFENLKLDETSDIIDEELEQIKKYILNNNKIENKNNLNENIVNSLNNKNEINNINQMNILENSNIINDSFSLFNIINKEDKKGNIEEEDQEKKNQEQEKEGSTTLNQSSKKENEKEMNINPLKKIVKNNINNKNFDLGENKTNNIMQKEQNKITGTVNKDLIFTKCFMCSKKLESREKYCEICIRQRMFDILYDYYQSPKFQIDEKNFFLDQYIIRNNSNYKKEIKKEEILKNIKDYKLCLFEKEHQKYQQKLPCGCHICNYLIEFLKKYNFQTSFRCKCLKRYSRVDMIFLEQLFEEIDKDISNTIINKYFNKRLDNCCMCDSHLNKKNNIITNMSVPKDKNSLLTNFINRNNHYICDKCMKKLGSEFQCHVCNIKHLLNK